MVQLVPALIQVYSDFLGEKTYLTICKAEHYSLSEAWSGVNWADLMAAKGALGTDFYDRSILCPKHRAYYRSGTCHKNRS